MASATPGRIPVWAVPLSLAATDGIDVSFFSCGYLDVSVPRVGSIPPIHSAGSNAVLPALCFHIQKSPDQCLFASFPELIAGYNVLRRLSMPRHPPYTLSSLTTFIDHRHDHPTEELTPGQSPAGEPETVQTINKGRFAEKVLDDFHPTERPKWVGIARFSSVSR